MQLCCSVELLHSCFDERCYLRDISAARCATARNLEVDGHAIQRVPDIVGQLSELGRRITVIHKGSIAQVCVVGCRCHDSEVGMRHWTMLRRRMNILRHEIARVVDLELPEQEVELSVVLPGHRSLHVG